MFLLNMIQPMNSLRQESEITWKIRKGVKGHLGHYALPKAAKYVTQRGPLRLSPCPSKPTTVSMEKLELKNCNVTQEKNRRVAAVLANVMGSPTTTIKSVCCNCSFQNTRLQVGVKTQDLDSLYQSRGRNRKRSIQQIRT